MSSTGVAVTGALSSTGCHSATSDQTTPTDGSAYFYKSSTGATLSGSQVVLETGSAGSRSAKVTVDASGNLGLGVTPSAWQSAYKVVQVNTSGSIFGTTNGQVNVASNYYVDSAGNNVYTLGNAAALYNQFNGVHRWYTAPTGTAGNAFTFTRAMTLDASGLMVGRTGRQNNGTIEALGTGQQAFVAQVTNNGNSTFQGFNAAGAATFFATGNGDVYLYSVNTLGSGALPISVNGSERARIDSSGNFGIGTETPAYKLEVNGSFAATSK